MPAKGFMVLTDLLGLTNVNDQEKAKNYAVKTLIRSRDKSDELYGGEDGIISKINANKDSITELLGGEDAVKEYVDAVNGFDPNNFKTDLSRLENYSYDKTVDQFMDPAADYTINQSVKATQNAMAGQGGLSGGAAAAQLQAVASEKASELYDKAYERMSEDKNFDYGHLKDLVNAETANNQTALSAETQKISNLGNVSGSYLDALQNASEEEINAMIAQLNNNNNFNQAIAQAELDYEQNGTSLLGLLKGIFS